MSALCFAPCLQHPLLLHRSAARCGARSAAPALCVRMRLDGPPAPATEEGKTLAGDSASRAVPPPQLGGLPLEGKQEMLEVYYGTDETTYMPNLANVWVLGSRNFAVELSELVRSLRRVVGMELPSKYAPPDCLGLTLSDSAVREREQRREAMQAEASSSSSSRPVAPPVVLLYKVLCQLIDVLFAGRPIARMWFLEVVARIPYFSYTSCLHLLATLGWWRSAELSNIHHAEELNEAFHLSVMESLGGDRKWGDRFMAFHAAIAYYWFLVALFFISPSSSYGFSELLEGHAVDTYGQLLDENAETLRELPAPDVAHVYFADFLYYFEAFQLDSNSEGSVRRPVINNLYDVFENIYLDELEHVKTMTACRAYTSDGKPLQYKGRDLRSKSRMSRKAMSAEERRSYWKKWTASKQHESASQTTGTDAATKG